MKLTLATFLLMLSISAFSNPLGETYISENACPGEGCCYGYDNWAVNKDTSVFSKPEINSSIIANIKANSEFKTITGEIHIIPGIAKVTGQPYKESKEVNSKDPVYILDYVGEGRTRIYQNGKFYITKIATSKEQCPEKHDWRRCWVEVLKEPVVTFWWVKIKFGKNEGWVQIKDNNIGQTNACY